MKVQLAHILQSLYRTTELDDVPVHQLQETLREHPYFTAVQFLLAQKLKSQRTEQYDGQVEKTAIYFHDPLWMHWQLNHDEEAALKIESPSVTVQEHIESNGTVHAPVEHIAATEDEQDTVEVSNSLQTESYPTTKEVNIAEEHAEVEQSIDEEPQHVSFIVSLDGFQSHETDKHAAIPGAHAGEPNTHAGETDFHIGESDSSNNESDVVSAESDTKSYSDLHPGEINTDVDESGRNEWTSVPESIRENGAETIESPVDRVEAAGPTSESASSSIETIEPSSEIIRDDSEDRPIEETNPAIQLTDTATTQAEVTDDPVAEKGPIPFDPYYTIDYFASQGIKAPAEVEPTDKLGRQLKSFTEWLKTMKRLPLLPVEQQVEEPDEAAQQNIRRIADDSLKDKEVVTETMAEVLIKQDRKEEAIGIYEKLSLLDPSKSAYFAAKIENLKVN